MYTVSKEFYVENDELKSKLSVYERHTVKGELVASGGLLELYPSVPLSINGWYMLNIFAADRATQLVYSTNLVGGTDPVAELDNGIIPDELQNALSLSANATVSTRERGCKWFITDQGQGSLSIYGSGGCRWRKTDNQRPFLVEVWKGGSYESGRLDVYRSNTANYIIPDLFFFDNTPPVIATVKILRDGTPVHSGTNYFNAVTAYFTENGSGIDYRATSIEE